MMGPVVIGTSVTKRWSRSSKTEEEGGRGANPGPEGGQGQGQDWEAAGGGALLQCGMEDKVTATAAVIDLQHIVRDIVAGAIFRGHITTNRKVTPFTLCM